MGQVILSFDIIALDCVYFLLVVCWQIFRYVHLVFCKLLDASLCLQRRCQLSTWLSPSLTPLHANPSATRFICISLFTTSTHSCPCKGKLIMESYKARTKASSMKNKTLFFHLVTFIWKCLRVKYFALILKMLLSIWEISTFLTGRRDFYGESLWPTSNIYKESYCPTLTFASRFTSY